MTDTVSAPEAVQVEDVAGPHSALLLKAQQQAERHVAVEITEDIDEILGTLAESGPYAYTLTPTETGPGLQQKLISSREEIRQAYVQLHDLHGLRGWVSTTQVLSPWYAFHAGWSMMEVKDDGSSMLAEAVVIFPTMGKVGITGELFWARMMSDGPSLRENETTRELRQELLASHDDFLTGLRSGDVTAALKGMAPRVQTGVRDYLASAPGLLTELDGADALQEHLQRFFQKYEVVDLTIVQRHVDDWFVFAETRWTVEPRDGGQRLSFNVAEYSIYDPDRMVVARIGHGTTPVSA